MENIWSLRNEEGKEKRKKEKKKKNNGWYDFYILLSSRFYGSAGEHNQEQINNLSERREGRGGAPGGSKHKSKSRPKPERPGYGPARGWGKMLAKLYHS